MTDPSIHTIYTGRSTNWPLIWLSTALVVPLLVMANGSDGSWTSVDIVIPLAVIVAAMSINVVTASSVRATAAPTGSRCTSACSAGHAFGTRSTTAEHHGWRFAR